MRENQATTNLQW